MPKLLAVSRNRFFIMSKLLAVSRNRFFIMPKLLAVSRNRFFIMPKLLAVSRNRFFIMPKLSAVSRNRFFIMPTSARDRLGTNRCITLYQRTIWRFRDPEWYISSMLYSGDTPFWSGTLVRASLCPACVCLKVCMFPLCCHAWRRSSSERLFLASSVLQAWLMLFVMLHGLVCESFPRLLARRGYSMSYSALCQGTVEHAERTHACTCVGVYMCIIMHTQSLG